MTELHDLPLTRVVDLLNSRQVSSVELLRAVLRRIEATEPQVHAYAHLMIGAAERTAFAADRTRAEGGPAGPLLGVPVAVKDMIYAAGAPTEAGSLVMRGHVPARDARAVGALRAAGAIVLGKTVTHEFAYSQNEPATRCPWDIRCYPGSSSAGSGVAVAAGSAFAALGTDTGGSVRAPASVNGVVALKPTYDVVSRDGVIPLSPTMDAVGPITRTVADCALLLSCIAEPERLRPARVGRDRPRVGVDWAAHFTTGLDPEVVAASTAAVTALASLGAEVVDVCIPHAEMVSSIGLLTVLVDASSWHARRLRNSPELYSSGTRVMLQAGELVTGAQYVKVQRARRALVAGVRQVFETHQLDAVALPTLPVTTFPLELYADPLTATSQDGWARVMHHAFLANLTGLPAVTVPCGLSSRSLPIGLELLGRPYQDLALLELARMYEEATEWHEMRPPEDQLVSQLTEEGP